MRIAIGYRPGQSMARVVLDAGESIVAEGGAMVGMSTNVHMQTGSGGVLSGLKRMFGGESFFRNTYTAQGGEGEVLLAQALCGDMALLDVGESGWFVQSSSFVASTPAVRLDTASAGARGFFSGEGLFVLRATAATAGQQLLVGAFGGVESLACDGDLLIDTGHLVAWEGTLRYHLARSAQGLLASFFSGEGFVCRFEGTGRVLVQTRNPSEYGGFVGRRLPPRQA